MKALILGNGLIAKAIARKLMLQGFDVEIISRNIEDKIEGAGYQKYSLEEITERGELFDGVDTVIHTISTSAPSNSMQNIFQDAYQNILLNIKLMELLVRLGNIRLVFLSSGGAVYGNPVNEMVSETHSTNPISAYGVAKLSVEKYLHLYGYHYGLNYLIIRPSNIYGYVKNIRKPQGVINHLLDCAINNKTFKLWGSITNAKDYLYIDDFAEAILLAVNHDKEMLSNVYNISFGKTHSLAEIIGIIESQTNKKISFEKAGDTKFDVKNIHVDSTLFKQHFHWNPRVGLAAGIEAILSQY